jgi:hypothetical protein
MYQTYQTYLSSLNNEDINYEHDENNSWGQHYDMETKIFINTKFTSFRPLKNQNFTQIKKNVIAQPDLESGLKMYIDNESNKSQKCQCSFIASLIYLAHLVLFIMLFK